MRTLTCACGNTADQVLDKGIVVDPAGWSIVQIDAGMVTVRRACPGCTRRVLAILGARR